MNETCQSCRFSQLKTDAPGLHVCKRNPPQVIEADGDMMYLWPNVDGDQWCGRWEPRVEKARA